MKHFKVRKLVLLALVLIGVGTVGTWLTRESATDSHNPVEVTVPVAGMDSLRINASNRRIDFAVSNNDEVRVVMAGNTRRTDLTADVVDNEIVIEARQRRQFMSLNFDGIGTSTLTVYLPEHEFEQITASTTNGGIVADNLLARDVSLRTSNGQVEARNLQGNLEIRTTNGRVNVSHIAGDIQVRTTNGRIEFVNPTLAQNVEMQTTNGRIEMELAEEPTDAAFRTSTTNGSVSIFGSDSWDSGSVYEINLRTTNGGITVRTR